MIRLDFIGRATMAALLLGTLSACGGMEVRTDYDPGTDFSTMSTFHVLDEAGDNTAPGFWDERIKRAIATTMTERGWQEVDSPDEADLTVGYQLITEQRSSFQTVNTGWGGYGYGWGGWYGPGWGGGVSTSQTTERRYTVGSLIIAMFDHDRKEMVFTSTGSDEIDQRQRSPEEAQAIANDVVNEILRDFPPGR